MQPGQPQMFMYPQAGYGQPGPGYGQPQPGHGGYGQPGQPVMLPGQPAPQQIQPQQIQPAPPVNVGYGKHQQPAGLEQSPLRAIVPPSKDSVSVDISLPGKKVEGEEIKAGPPVIASEGHEIDARRRAPEPRPGASVPLSFNDPKAAEIVEPNFIFPDHAKPDMRPWLPTFTEKWYTFDNPIDNNLVRGASFVVFLTAIMIFIFGMKT
eukprot:2473731-Rhodomonas_salina.1